MSDTFTKLEYRELTPEERKLIEWLVANGNAASPAYASQVDRLRVVACCPCGCPTLDVAVGEKKFRTVGVSTVLADAVGHSPEGVPVDVILHARENEISELEVVSLDDTKTFSMPTPEMLEIV